MAYDVVQLLPIGSTSTNLCFASSVGTRVIQGGVVYRLMRVGAAAIPAAANVFVKFQTGSALLWVVDAVAGAAASAGTVAGIPQLPTGVTAAPANAFLWVARKGRVTGTTVAAVAAGVALATHGAAGGVDDLTVVFDTMVARAPDAIASATTGTLVLWLE